MKRALVFSLIFALGIGVAGFAGAFTGSWDTELCLDWDNTGVDPVIDFGDFYSTLFVDYTVSGWVLGSNMVFDNTGLSMLWFDAAGNFGAFSFTTILEFAPADAEFTKWENIVEVSIAGVNFYGVFAMSGPAPIGVGFAFGAVATAGDINFGAEIQFGAGGDIYYVEYGGPQYAYGYYDGYNSCGYMLTHGFVGTGDDCDPGFTGFDLFVGFPFTCLDVTIFGGFSCENGFDSVSVLLENIDIGAGWFNIDSMAITFQTSGKSLCLDLDLTLGDAVCVTPYLTLVNDGEFIVDGISLNALTLTYNYNGVTFKAGEIFNDTWERELGTYDAYSACGTMVKQWGFTKTGSISATSRCWILFADGVESTVKPNEFFGISIDGDSCCGGGFSVDLYNFMVFGGDAGEYGIFGWVGSYGEVSVDIGTAFTIGASAKVGYLGMESLCFNFGFSW